MPRPSRLLLPELPHHITQRGNYRQRTYFRAEDYRLYLQLLKDYSRHHGVTLLGYGLMPNHVHLVAGRSAPTPSPAHFAGFTPSTPAPSTCACGA